MSLYHTVCSAKSLNPLFLKRCVTPEIHVLNPVKIQHYSKYRVQRCVQAERKASLEAAQSHIKSMERRDQTQIRPGQHDLTRRLIRASWKCFILSEKLYYAYAGSFMNLLDKRTVRKGEWLEENKRKNWTFFRNLSTVRGWPEHKHTDRLPHTQSVHPLLASVLITSEQSVHWLFGANKHKRSSCQVTQGENSFHSWLNTPL